MNFAELCGESMRVSILATPRAATAFGTDTCWDELWDHVADMVWVTVRDTFLTRLDFASRSDCRSVTAIRS